MAAWCFSLHLGNAGGYVVSLSMILFAFGTVIAWYYLGSQALTYLASLWAGKGGKNAPAQAVTLYQLLYLCALGAGCVASMEKVWLFSDIVNGLLALPNLAALILLAGQVEFPARLRLSQVSHISENGVFWIVVFLGAVRLLFL